LSYIATTLIEMATEYATDFLIPVEARTVADSGSPIVARDDNGTHTVVGLLSIGNAKNQRITWDDILSAHFIGKLAQALFDDFTGKN